MVAFALNVPLLQLTDQMCKWPSGDPTDPALSFCCQKNWNGLPYCEYHSRVAYQPPEKRSSRGNNADAA